MNEIIKLYKNAGVEKEFEKPAECVKNPYITCDGCMLYDDKRGQCNNKKDYPPFTAEKQLELIKFLLDKYCDIRIRKNLEGAYYIKSFNDISCFSEDFEETLANFMNTHLQDLTEEEKEQIKEILE